MEENEKIEENKMTNASQEEVVETVEVNEVVADNAKQDSKGLSIASLVLGIVSLVGMRMGILAIACGILAIVFGVKGKKRAGKGMAKAGLIMGIISLSFMVLALILVLILGFSFGALLLSSAAMGV